MQNLTFVSLALLEILGVSQKLKSRLRDLGHAPFWSNFYFLVQYPLHSISLQNLMFVSLALLDILRGSQNLKSRSRDLGHAPF